MARNPDLLWELFSPVQPRSGALYMRAANEDPAHVADLREQFRQLGAGALMHCLQLAINILKRDRTPLAKTRGWLMYNLIQEEKERRCMSEAERKIARYIRYQGPDILTDEKLEEIMQRAKELESEKP